MLSMHMRAWRKIFTGAALSVGVGASLASALNVDVLNSPYSARGDGTSNDRVAIQNAINDVNSAGGGEVLLPGGRVYLSGDLQLKSNVTLRILGSLKSSLTTSDYAHTPQFDRTFNPEQCAWDDKYLYNFPLIYIGSGTSNVRITGGSGTQGTLRIASGGSTDASNIFMAMIGAYNASGITIDSIKLRNAKGYNTAFIGCDNLTINAINMDSVFNTGSDLNCDGVSLNNCQNVHISNSFLRVNDDIVYPWSSDRDPRGRTWWNSNTPEPCMNIEVDHNTMILINNMYAPHNFTVINWSGCATNKGNAQISGINVHDNTMSYAGSGGSGIFFEMLGTDPMHGGCGWAPVSNFTWRNNTNQSSSSIGNMPCTVTDCNVDFSNSSWRSPSSLQNTNFENYGTPYWSLRKNGNNGSAGADTVDKYAGFYSGFIANLDLGDAKIYQGLWLSANTYTFKAYVKSSGVTTRLFARDKDDNLIASADFNNTGWANQGLSFAVSSAKLVRLGIERGNATSGWARIDNAQLATGGTMANARFAMVEKESICIVGNVVLVRTNEKSTATIFRTNGREVKKLSGSNNQSYLFVRLEAGVYCVRVQTERKTFVGTMIIGKKK